MKYHLACSQHESMRVSAQDNNLCLEEFSMLNQSQWCRPFQIHPGLILLIHVDTRLIQHDPRDTSFFNCLLLSLILLLKLLGHVQVVEIEKGVNMGGRWTCTEFSPLESGKCTSSSGKMAGTSNMLNSGMAGNSSCSSNFKATVVESNDTHDKGRELWCSMPWQVWLIRSRLYSRQNTFPRTGFYLNLIIQIALY